MNMMAHTILSPFFIWICSIMRRYSDVVRSSFHFINGLRCQSHKHGASCAVDSLMEIFKHCFISKDPTLITFRVCNLLMSALIKATEARAVFGPVCEIRDTVWDLLVLPNAYHPKGRHDADIEAAFQFLPHKTGSKFALCNFSLLACTHCGVNRHVTASTAPILCYTQGVKDMYPNNLAAGLSATMQEQISDQFTTIRLCGCDSQLINVKSSIYMPDFLMLQLEVSGHSTRNLQTPPIVASQSMCLMGHQYYLVGAIQMCPSGGHLVSITPSNRGTYKVTNDLQDSVSEFPTFSAATSGCVGLHSWETPLTPQNVGVPMLFYKKAENMPLPACATSHDQPVTQGNGSGGGSPNQHMTQGSWSGQPALDQVVNQCGLSRAGSPVELVNQDSGSGQPAVSEVVNQGSGSGAGPHNHLVNQGSGSGQTAVSEVVNQGSRSGAGLPGLVNQAAGQGKQLLVSLWIRAADQGLVPPIWWIKAVSQNNQLLVRLWIRAAGQGLVPPIIWWTSAADQENQHLMRSWIRPGSQGLVLLIGLETRAVVHRLVPLTVQK